MLLIGRALVGIARRYVDPDAEFLGEIEEAGNFFRRLIVEDGRIDVDVVASRLGGLDRLDGNVEHAVLAHGAIMLHLHAVEVYGDREIRRRLEKMELFLKQQRVRAERDELFARHDAFDDLADFLMDQRLAAGDGDHRRAALIDRVQTFLHAEALVQDRRRIVDLATPDAREVAAKQRLQHQNERVVFPPHQLLLEDVATDLQFLVKRNIHTRTSTNSSGGALAFTAVR